MELTVGGVERTKEEFGCRGWNRICLEQWPAGFVGISRYVLKQYFSFSQLLGTNGAFKHNGVCFSDFSPAHNDVYLTSFKSTKPVN